MRPSDCPLIRSSTAWLPSLTDGDPEQPLKTAQMPRARNSTVFLIFFAKLEFMFFAPECLSHNADVDYGLQSAFRTLCASVCLLLNLSSTFFGSFNIKLEQEDNVIYEHCKLPEFVQDRLQRETQEAPTGR